MPSKTNIIDIIISKTGMKQMDIAKKLGVSRAQVSKWKSGEDIPDNRREALNEMAGLFGDDTEWCLLTKTPENAENWIDFFVDYHEGCLEVDPCSNISDYPESWVPTILALFNKVGIKIPEIAPNLYTEDTDSDDFDYSEESSFYVLVKQYLESFAALINWYDDHILDIDISILDDVHYDFEAYIVDFALIHVDKDIL